MEGVFMGKMSRLSKVRDMRTNLWGWNRMPDRKERYGQFFVFREMIRRATKTASEW